jgi:hypothetical protein
VNQELQDYARAYLAEGLAKLPDQTHRTFRLMYGRKGGTRSVDDALAMPLADVIKEMPPNTLDWAMTQLDNSLAKVPA